MVERVDASGEAADLRDFIASDPDPSAGGQALELASDPFQGPDALEPAAFEGALKLGTERDHVPSQPVLSAGAFSAEVLAAALMLAALALGVSPAVAARPATGRTISVRVGPGSFSLPSGFQGVSIPSSDVPSYAAGGARLKRVLSLVRAPGVPLTVRVGAAAADRMWWVGLDRPAPPGVTPIGPNWLTALRTVAASVPERVVLTVNLANDDPDGEARFALAAHLAMPAGTLAAVEIGNEPDLSAAMVVAGAATAAERRVRDVRLLAGPISR